MRRAASQAAYQVRSRLLDSGAITSSRGFSTEPVTIALFPGDGIGPEIADSVKSVFNAAGVPLQWDEQHIGKTPDPRTNSMVTRENLDSLLVSSTTLSHPPPHCHLRSTRRDNFGACARATSRVSESIS